MVTLAAVYVVGAIGMLAFSWLESWSTRIANALLWPLIVAAIALVGLYEFVKIWRGKA